MKKSKLIDMLSKIEGDPDILFYNAYVDDWMDFEPRVVDEQLTRMSFEYYKDLITAERIYRHHQPKDYKVPAEEIPALKKAYKNTMWASHEYVTADDISSGRYRSKRVSYILAKPRGLMNHNRCSSIGY